MNLSRKEVLPAQELGTEARRIVSRKGSAGKILASLSGGVYFLTDDQEIFWVYPDSSPMHRRCIRTAFLPESCRFQPEQRFRIEPCLIRGDSFGVDLRGAKEWNPLLPEQVLQHQYEFLSYGLTAAWVILAVYVLMMVRRERKLKREIASLKAMLEEKQGPGAGGND